MKNYLFLFLAASLFLSCSKDDNENKTIQTYNVVGTWKIQSIVTGDGDNLELNDCDNGFKTVFLANGLSVDYYNCDGEITEDPIPYSVAGNILTFTVPNETPTGGTLIVKGLILEANPLRIKVKLFYYSDEGNVNGNTVTYIPF